MRTIEQVQRRKQYLAHLPWWRKPFWGYLLAFPLIACALLIPLLFDRIGLPNVFLGAPMFLAAVFTAWLWGTGPAIIAIVLGTLALDYFFLSPSESFTLERPNDLSFLPFLLAQLVLVLITAGRGSARRKALLAQQELQAHARELEQTNQALEQANLAKERFLSLASHELKTPLTLICTQVQYGLRRLAKQNETSPESATQRELLEQVNQQTRYLQGLIKDILDLSLLGGRQMPLRIGRCDLSTTCQEIIEALRASTGRSMVLQTPPTPFIIDADCERIGQVIINLVTNAIKYSPEASTIVISISQSESAVTLQVHNEGQVIPHEQQARLFEPFYRTPHAQASPQEGSGLGLAISREIVERHQGRIWVASSSEKGTSFFVQLPLKAFSP